MYTASAALIDSRQEHFEPSKIDRESSEIARVVRISRENRRLTKTAVQIVYWKEKEQIGRFP